ncbi:hypothetical protein ACQJBY_051834 [Aegilops geniculata]
MPLSSLASAQPNQGPKLLERPSYALLLSHWRKFGSSPPPSPRVQRRPREELEPQRWSMVSSPSSSAGEAWAAETAGSVRSLCCRPSTLEDNVFVQLICIVSIPGC